MRESKTSKSHVSDRARIWATVTTSVKGGLDLHGDKKCRVLAATLICLSPS